MSSIDYNCVIRTIKVVNEEGIWYVEDAMTHIQKKYDINTLPYGQVIHVYNVNPGGDELHLYFVVYDGKLVFTEGDQYLLLNYSFTKHITDICAKYPEYTFSDQFVARCFPKTDFFKHVEEECYQSMNGYISGNDVLVKKMFGSAFDESYTVYVDVSDVEITNTTNSKSRKYDYDYDGFTLCESKTVEQVIEELA